MTTELSQLQTKNPPKKDKNDGCERIHGEGLTEMACPQEIKGAGHAASGAMAVKDQGEEARESDGPNVQADQMGERICGRQRGKAEAHELFAGQDRAAQGQTGSWGFQ